MEWISVEDRLPDCLSVQYIGQAESAGERWRSESEQYIVFPKGFVDCRCKLWMPLPEPPK